MENNDNDFTPDDALAGDASARRAIARRIATPPVWDAAFALSVGIFLGLIAYVEPPWTTIVLAGWVIVFLGLHQGRRKRTGATVDGGTRRTFDPLLLGVFVSVIVVFVAGLVMARWWEGSPIVAAAVATAALYGGFRWVNRRAVSRALGGS